MSEQGDNYYGLVKGTEQKEKGRKYSGHVVTPNNYNLFTKQERLNAQRELKAFLSGKDVFKAKATIDGKETWVMRKVRTAEK